VLRIGPRPVPAARRRIQQNGITTGPVKPRRLGSYPRDSKSLAEPGWLMPLSTELQPSENALYWATRNPPVSPATRERRHGRGLNR
jgi:hypothetical protein